MQIKKSRRNQYNDVIRRMRSFLDHAEPRLTVVLSRVTRRMQNTITYEELRQQLLLGGVNKETVDRWMQEYSKFFTEEILPEWKKSMEYAAEEIRLRYPEFVFDPNSAAIKQWAVERSAKMIVSITALQRQAVNQMIQRAVQIQDIPVDELAKVIRPMVGLTPGQVTANLRYFQKVRDTLVKNGMSLEKATLRAKKQSIMYAEKQHRYRCMSIARTEVMEAYRAGEHNAIKQAQAQGFIGRVKKVWVTAGDDRVCDKCRELDGKSFEIDDILPTTNLWEQESGGAHPNCRCILVYEEVD